MENGLILTLNSYFNKKPILKGIPSNIEDIKKAENELSISFDKDYVRFLELFGGCLIGAEEIRGLVNAEIMEDIENVVELTKECREDDSELNSWLIIATDSSGNPIGIHSNRKVYLVDYEFDELVELASSFNEYLNICLAKT